MAVKSLTSSVIKDTNQTNSNAIQPNSHTLTMSDFEENKNESDKRLLLDHKLFIYVTLKHVAHRCQEINCILSDVRSFLGTDDRVKTELSRIHYMELVNESPDIDETMCIVAEDLLEKFNIEEQDGWVLLVGEPVLDEH